MFGILTQKKQRGPKRICQNPNCGKEFYRWNLAGGVEPKYCSQACFFEVDRTRRVKNPDTMRIWRETHREQDKALKLKWLQNNPDKRKESLKKYKASHPDKVKVSHGKYYENNKESEKRRNDEYRKKHPEIAVATAEKRRAAKAAGNGISAKDIRQLKADYHGVCPYCGKKKKLTLDHIVPLIAGGAHDMDNAAPACLSCNSSKTDKPLLIFLYDKLLRRR